MQIPFLFLATDSSGWHQWRALDNGVSYARAPGTVVGTAPRTVAKTVTGTVTGTNQGRPVLAKRYFDQHDSVIYAALWPQSVRAIGASSVLLSALSGTH